MASLTLRAVKGSELSIAEMDNNLSALNNEKLDIADWPTFVGTASGNINATDVGGTNAVSRAAGALDMDDWCSDTYMASLLRLLSANELSVNQAAAVAGVLSALQSQISLILSKLDSVA